MKQTLLIVTAAGSLLAACSGSDACLSDSDCPAGRYCGPGGCTFDCTFDRECPAELHCTARGRCEHGCVQTNHGDEACDGLDNDCDGQTDEEWPELNEGCQHPPCAPGLVICKADGSGTTCDAKVPALDDSTCDGADDDCDGQTDEDAGTRPCPLQTGICQGAGQACVDGEWAPCDYGPEFTPDLDATCDNLDTDCDGQTDEDAPALMDPEVGALADNGLDDNCNGLVDERGGLMIEIPAFPGVWIDAYEIGVYQNADCSGRLYGQDCDDFPADWPVEGQPSVTLFACSLPGALPSGYLSWHRASWACQAQGKRLCGIFEWTAGCQGALASNYPYSPGFIPEVCNDAWSGSGHKELTGSRPDCCSDHGVHDTSGNLAEWTSSDHENCPGAKLISGLGYACELCYCGLGCAACEADDETEVLERSKCVLYPDVTLGFPPDAVLPYIGARCCFEPR